MNLVTLYLYQLLAKSDAERGQGLVEYGLILVLISIAAVMIMSLFGEQLNEVFNEVTTTLANA